MGIANSADISAADRPTLRALPQFFFFSIQGRPVKTTLGVYSNVFPRKVYKVGRVGQVGQVGQSARSTPEVYPNFISNSTRSARTTLGLYPQFFSLKSTRSAERMAVLDPRCLIYRPQRLRNS